MFVCASSTSTSTSPAPSPPHVPPVLPVTYITHDSPPLLNPHTSCAVAILPPTQHNTHTHTQAHVDQWEDEGKAPLHDIFKRLGDLGVLCVDSKEEDGGMGLDFSFKMAIGEELGNIDCGALPMAIQVCVCVVRVRVPLWQSRYVCVVGVCVCVWVCGWCVLYAV